jgi:hypothetical protein
MLKGIIAMARQVPNRKRLRDGHAQLWAHCNGKGIVQPRGRPYPNKPAERLIDDGPPERRTIDEGNR